MAVPLDNKRKAVAQFLNDWQTVAACQKPYIQAREENLKVLKELGLTYTDQWELLKNLSIEDYVDGPEPDRDRPGYVWIFGVFIGGAEIYIKVKLVEYKPLDSHQLVRQALCISFHVAKYPLTYPLK